MAYDAAYASYLKSLAESLDCVTKVRLNPAASSIVVEYDSNKVVTPDTVQKQVLTAIEQAARSSISQSEQNSPSVTAKNSNLSWRRRVAGGAPDAILSSPNFSQEGVGSEALSKLKEVEAVGVDRIDTGLKGDGEPVPTSLPSISRAGATRSEPLSAIELAETDLPHPDATDLAQENSTSCTETKNLHTLKEKNSLEYALLVRGNYSISTRLNLGEGSASKSV